MELKPLESFLAVISTGSITGAARALGRSQPVVTRHIQDLEAEIGFPLFRRNGPRISPTEQGLRFHVEVERLSAGLNQLSERAMAIATATTPSIEIAAIPSLAAGLVPDALTRLPPEKRPRVLHLRSGPAEQVVQSVLARNADIGIASLPLDHPGLELHRLYGAPCVVALSTGHALAHQTTVRLADLAGLDVITMANPFRLRQRVEQAFAAAGVRPGRTIDTNATINALQLARCGLGAAIVEPVTALGVPIEGVVVRPLDTNIVFQWGVVTALHAPLSPAAQSVLGCLDAAARALLPDVSIHQTRPGEAPPANPRDAILEEG